MDKKKETIKLVLQFIVNLSAIIFGFNICG